MGPTGKMLLVACTVLTQLGCAEPRHHDEHVAPLHAPTTVPLLVSLERSACYGICPVYSLTIHKDGAVEYQGGRFVKVKGTASARLSEPSLAELDRAVNNAHLESMAASYEHATITDRATVTVSFVRGGKLSSVRHNLGDDSAPRALLDLEQSIDAIVGVEQWTGTAAERLAHVGDWQ